MKPFIPEINQEYYFIKDNGEISTALFWTSPISQYRIQTGNCYETLEAAEYHRRMEAKSWQIRQMSFEPDWSDQEQEKHYFYFYHDEKEYNHCFVYFAQAARTYFIDEETLRAAFDGVSNDDFLYMQSRGLI